jgi:hypothetical protein
MQSVGIEKERTPTVAQVRALLLLLLQEPVSFFLHGLKLQSASPPLTVLPTSSSKSGCHRCCMSLNLSKRRSFAAADDDGER